MRNPPGELADGLHLLALDELRLQRLELGRIAQHRDQNRFLRLHRAVQRDLHEHLAVLSTHAQKFGMDRAAPRRRIPQPVGDRPPQPLQRIAQAQVGHALNPQQFARGPVRELDQPLRRELQERDRQGIEKCPAVRRTRPLLDSGQEENLTSPRRALAHHHKAGRGAVRGGDVIDLTGA